MPRWTKPAVCRGYRPWTPTHPPPFRLAGCVQVVPEVGVGLFHLHVRNISRSDGRSAVACAAYRAGETLPNEAEEKASAFGGRRDVVFAEIRAPIGAAGWMRERASLWNGAERAERRKDARLAKEIEFSLPRLLPRAEWLGLARRMADAYVSRGHIVDLAVHDDGTAHNPHVHLMLTTRLIGDDGFGPKIRAADGRQFVQEARSTWASIANVALAAAGLGSIDPRSHAARGITESPGQHFAPDRDARREHREERARMTLQEEVIEARNALLAVPDIRQRYPLLSGRPDWPPEQRHVEGYLPPETKAEHDRFWREVHRRALEPEIGQGEVATGEEREEFAAEAGRLLTVAEAAEAREGYIEKLVATNDGRAQFYALRDRMVTQMVRAGLMDPRTAEQVRMIEQKLYPDDFTRMRAEAQRIEAKRLEASVEPQPTRTMLRQAAQLERQEFEGRGSAFEPPRHLPVAPVPVAQFPAPSVVPDPVPDPDGRPIAPAGLAQAEELMIQEVERPSRAVPETPRAERAPEDERAAAVAAVERQNSIEVKTAEADSYRVAPQENRLDWLQGLPCAATNEKQSNNILNMTTDRLQWQDNINKSDLDIENNIEHDRIRQKR